MTSVIVPKGGSQDTVESSHSDCLSWLENSLLPRSLMKGTKGMEKQGTKFLPQDYLEKDKAYDVRLKRSTLVNAYGKTVTFLGGQVFQKDMVFVDETPDEVTKWNKDIDLKGTDIDTFGKRIFEKGLGEGVVHIIVDTNNKDGEYNSKKEEKEAGVRPFFRAVKGENLFAYVDGDGKLSQIRINETVTKRDGEFGVKIVPQIRVLEPGSWRTFQNESGPWKEEDKGETSLDYIPIISYIPGEVESIVTGKTPLMDLAELNLDHWQSYSDQKNILHHARLPILFGKMLDLDIIEKSPNSTINSDNKDGDLKYVEITGKAIESGQKDLTETEAKMAMWGLQQLIQKPGVTSATERSIASAESNSSLGSWASIFESFMNAAYTIMSDYENTEYPDEMVSVNKNYSLGIIDPEMVKVYIEMVDSRTLSAASAFREIKRRGFISEDLDWLDVIAEMEKERQASDLLPPNLGTTDET